ncbi:exodeoxyribonuclease VII large subunit [Algibacter miyuki]|uniref:Exodeoxyribonuclease VII large subunit n=1 Tax=Algibacter miyuki TaxID=1306933 RepID=A0ABV5GZN6_9FLAO|nr:exodeoxyribonuclease VII large subunit [Algibacter miyuki]MDN3667091.1 exodeoxyribonuclease VII large subunit [Algibacter miyuki]
MDKINTYTVSTLTSLYPQSLTSTLDAKIISLEGFFFDRKGKLYGACYYDELHDKNRKNKIALQLTPDLKSQLTSGNYYQMEGYIHKGQNITLDSRVPVFFRTTKILEYKAKEQLISKVEYDIVRERFNREFPVIQDILLNKMQEGSQPVLDVITGIQSTSQADYLKQLQDYKYYTIRHNKCNLSSEVELIKFINNYNFSDTDILIIMRGGGSGLEVFNHIELCKKVIEIPVPFITGIGHDADVTLLQKVSDMGLSTPTSVGAFLQKMVNIHKERKRLIEEKDTELLNLNKQVLKNEEASAQIINLQKKRLNLIYIILVILLIAIIILIFTK